MEKGIRFITDNGYISLTSNSKYDTVSFANDAWEGLLSMSPSKGSVTIPVLTVTTINGGTPITSSNIGEQSVRSATHAALTGTDYYSIDIGTSRISSSAYGLNFIGTAVGSTMENRWISLKNDTDGYTYLYPYESGKCILGTPYLYWATAYITNINGGTPVTSANIESQEKVVSARRLVNYTYPSNYWQVSANGHLLPISAGAFNVGSTDSPVHNIICTLVNGSVATSSDRKQKTEIADIDAAEAFIMELRPKKYKYIDGKRTHFGLIAQDVANAAKTVGAGDLALYRAAVIDGSTDEEGQLIEKYFDETEPDENLRWSLSYDEFIAPMIAVIQKQNDRIQQLEQKLEEIMK